MLKGIQKRYNFGKPVVADAAIYKELERRLHEADIAMSPNRAAELLQTMYEMSFRLPNDPEQKQIILKMDADQLYGGVKTPPYHLGD